MPLSPPKDRELLHTRTITMQGYRRSDGLWDIEGHIADHKNYGFKTRDRGEILVGEALHEMWLRLTTNDDLVIQEVEAVTDHGPHHICPNITPNYQRLVGVKIGPGWRKDIKDRLGGVQGCTHITELLGPIATTAYQTVYSWLAEFQNKPSVWSASVNKDGTKKRPLILNSCHVYDSQGEWVKNRWPDFYTGQDADKREKDEKEPDNVP